MAGNKNGGNIYPLWQSLSARPGGRWLFNRMLRWRVPYSGALGARVEDLQPGRSHISLRDRRAVRNHLNSIHAIALANLGEMASGLALMSALLPTQRAIVVALHIEYLKKARGRLHAEGRCELPEVKGPTDCTVQAEIRDAAGEAVARVRVQWRLDLRP